MKYGNVQRAYLGINYIDPMGLSEDELRERGLRRDIDGVLVQDVPTSGAAATAGIHKGDIITKINGVSTPSIPEMTEQIARYKPGDKISISYLRNEKEYTVNNVLLKNEDGTTEIIKTSVLDKLGADLISLQKTDAARLGIRGGVFVNDVGSGLLKKQTNMKAGFVILKAGGQPVASVDDLKKALQKQGKLQLEGMYPDYTGVYYYNVDLAGGEEF